VAKSTLKITREPFALTGENGEVVARQLAPLLLHPASRLPPASRNLVPTHG
jgi:hypothetical protein